MKAKVKNIDAQVRSLEEELRALKSFIEDTTKVKKKAKTFASLRGIWKGKVHFSMNEIKEAEIRSKSEF